jgi:hypothetical protein
MLDEQVLKWFDELLALGDEVRATRRRPAPGHITSDFVDAQLANRWFTRSLSLISRCIGPESEHYCAMKRHFTDHPKWPHVEQSYGILLAARDDYASGALFEIRSLVAAEIFDDLLEQGQALLQGGYKGPAAVVVGAVLEDALRKLCAKHSIELPEKPKLDAMNANLAKANIYNVLTQKKITALAGIRNDAAHGKWDSFSPADVEGMVLWTSDFMQRHFGS